MIETHLDTSVFGHPFIYKTETGSTNSDLLLLARNGAKEGTVIAAGYQSAGRGARGDSWLAPPGENMSLSVLCRPGLPAYTALKLTLLAAIILRQAILAFSDFQKMKKPKIKFKWPNDLVVGSKKLAGILLESTVRDNRLDALIAGFGLNINANSQKLTTRVEREVVSLVDLYGIKINIAGFCAHFIRVFDTLYWESLRNGLETVVHDWQAHSAFSGAHLKITQGGEIFDGIYAGLDSNGFLCYYTSSGERKKVISGRVTAWKKV